MKGFPIEGREVPKELVLLSIEDLMRILGVRRSTLCKIRKYPDFPKPVPLTRSRLGWRAMDIERWLESRMAEAGGPTAQQQQQG